jgi:hypothetical protein
MEPKETTKPPALLLLEMRQQQELPEILAPLLEQGLGREELCSALGYTRRTIDSWLALYGLKLARRYRLLERGDPS